MWSKKCLKVFQNCQKSIKVFKIHCFQLWLLYKAIVFNLGSLFFFFLRIIQTHSFSTVFPVLSIEIHSFKASKTIQISSQLLTLDKSTTFDLSKLSQESNHLVWTRVVPTYLQGLLITLFLWHQKEAKTDVLVRVLPLKIGRWFSKRENKEYICPPGPFVLFSPLIVMYMSTSSWIRWSKYSSPSHSIIVRSATATK